MAEASWSQLYDEAKTGVVAGIAGGTYRMKVGDVRALPQSRLLFLDLAVQQGPLAGRIAQVNLYLPEPGNRGAGFHFRNKIMGFGDLTETFRQMDSAGDIGAALDILADALREQIVDAEVELRKDGEYAGTNQLVKTKPIDDVPAAPEAETQTITAADVATVPVAPAAPPVPPAATTAPPEAPPAPVEVPAEVPF